MGVKIHDECGGLVEDRGPGKPELWDYLSAQFGEENVESVQLYYCPYCNTGLIEINEALEEEE